MKTTDNDSHKAPPTPGLTPEQERQLVRSAYENFPEAAQCFACESFSYGDKPGRPFKFVFVDDEGKRHTITEAAAVRGLRVFAVLVGAGRLPGLGLPAHYLSPADDFDALGEWDAFAFDALAQCAMFGEVIYG